MSKPKNIKFLQLLEAIPDTKEKYDQGLIKFIPVVSNEKRAKVPKGIQYTYEYIANNSEVFDPTTFNKNDNIGLVRGYGNISVLDIDGVKHLGDDKNREIKKYLLDIINSMDYPFIIQETQSNGYHCLYYTNDNGNFDLSNIFWPVERPDDFPDSIDEKTYNETLSNQTLGSNVIEVFQDLNGYIVFAPSNTKDGEYKLLSKDYTWEQITDNPVTGIEKDIDAIFKEKGFYVRERGIKPGRGNTINNMEIVSTLVTCTPEAIEELTRLTIELYKEAHKHGAKYKTSLYLGGYYSNHISIDSTEAIFNGISDGVKDIMDVGCINHATNTALHNYEVSMGKKKTLKGVEEANARDPKVKKILQNIHDVIDKDTHGGIDTPKNKSMEDMGNELLKAHETRENQENNTTNTNTDQVYNYSNKGKGSFLTAKSPVEYSISTEHNQKLQKAKQELVNLFDKDDQTHIKYLINGGFKHFRLPEKIKTPATIRVYKPDDVYYIRDSKLYGFPQIEKIITYNDSNNNFTFDVNVKGKPGATKQCEITTIFEDIGEPLHKLNKIKRVIDEMTVLNPSYYVCDGFKQENNEIYTTGENKIGFFAFTDIKRVQAFDPVKRVISNKQTYDFEIMTQDGKTSKYESFTIDNIVKELYNKGLLLKETTEFKSKILTFVMETDKKQGLETIKRPICPGFFYDVQHGKILYYFPDLETGKYDLREGVEVLNDIFRRIFANKIKYSTIYLAELLQTLCNVFKDVGLANGINKHLLLLQKGETLKSMILEMITHTFTTTNRFNETNDGDTKSAILRNANKSTLPQTLNDPKIPINGKDFKDITKALAYGYTGDVVADDQFGNGTNNRDAFRLLAVSHNEPNFILDKEGGEHRRLNIAIFTDADTPTQEQKDAINEYLTPINGEIKLKKLNAIGEAFIKFILEYFQTYTPDMNKELHKTGGWCLIDDFLKYLETESGIELNKGFYNRYEWDDLTENELILLRNRLRHNYEKTLKDNNMSIVYDEDKVKEYFSLNNMFRKRRLKNKSDEWVLIKSEFEEFVKSPGGLNRNIDGNDILKLLQIPKKFKRLKYDTTNEKLKENKITCLVMAPDEVLEYFYNEIIICDDDI